MLSFQLASSSFHLDKKNMSATKRPSYAREDTDIPLQDNISHKSDKNISGSDDLPNYGANEEEKHAGDVVDTAEDLVTRVIAVEDDPSLNPWTFRTFFLGTLDDCSSWSQMISYSSQAGRGYWRLKFPYSLAICLNLLLEIENTNITPRAWPILLRCRSSRNLLFQTTDNLCFSCLFDRSGLCPRRSHGVSHPSEGLHWPFPQPRPVQHERACLYNPHG